jgi:hypothetical protein
VNLEADMLAKHLEQLGASWHCRHFTSLVGRAGPARRRRWLVFAAGWASPPYRRQCQDTPGAILHYPARLTVGEPTIRLRANVASP